MRLKAIISQLDEQKFKELLDLIREEERMRDFQVFLTLPCAHSSYWAQESTSTVIMDYRRQHGCSINVAKLAVELADSIWVELGWVF